MKGITERVIRMLQRYKNILVPIDGSYEAELAFKKAVEVFLSSKAYFSRCKRNPSRIGLYHSECRRKSLF